MITGDPALDAWLTTHGWDIAITWLTLTTAAMVLPGLAQALKEDK